MLLVEVCEFLAAKSVAEGWSVPLVFGNNLTAGSMPDTPIDVATLYDYTSAPPIETFGATKESVDEVRERVVIEMPRIQVSVRGADYQSGRTLIGRIHVALRNVSGVMMSGALYHSIAAIDTPTLNQRDPNYKPIFVSNYQVHKEPES